MTEADTSTAEAPIESEEEQQPTADADTDAITENSEENSPESDDETPDVADPSRVLRIGSTLNRLLEDLRGTDDLDAAGRKRLSAIHKGVREDLAEVLSDELLEEYDRGAAALPVTPSRGELLIAVSHASGWIDGLVQSIQTAIMARQAMNGEGQPAPVVQPGKKPGDAPAGPGNYL
ncbi:proteasome activator [Brevibacterium sp. HMSC063G07]|uniref:proteasome activator n=1 Tax=Brevibacterium sp. HMSC063G07 TaxID=1739261 RepID=UPI0008A203F0|nr:proteasome activator [Brevibacterium sp. HMSC063G07]OFL67990.1 hypothetical protein HMPREF2757_08815 [Brevibacterium sp. HMSC063G07]